MTVDHEINLASAYRVVWERGKRILTVTFVTAVLAFLVTLLMNNRYGWLTELEVKPSRVGERAMSHWITPVEAYARYIAGDEVLLSIQKELKLDEEPFDIRKVDDLASRIDISKYKETSIILIYAEMETPEMAATVSNRLAELAIQRNLGFLEDEARVTLDLLDKTLSARIEDNTGREQTYLATQKKHMIEITQKYLDNLISQWQKHLSERDSLIVSCRELETRLAALDQAVTNQPEKIGLRRTLSEDLVLMEQIRKSLPDVQGIDLANVSIEIESLNQEHYAVLAQKDLLNAQLEGDRAKLTLIEELIVEMKKEIDYLQNQIYEGLLEVARAKAEYDRSYEIFGGIDKEYGWTPTTVFSERYDMAIINRAIPKDETVSPNRPAIAGLSGALAFLISFGYFLLRDLYGITRRRDTAAG